MTIFFGVVVLLLEFSCDVRSRDGCLSDNDMSMPLPRSLLLELVGANLVLVVSIISVVVDAKLSFFLPCLDMVCEELY